MVPRQRAAGHPPRELYALRAAARPQARGRSVPTAAHPDRTDAGAGGRAARRDRPRARRRARVARRESAADRPAACAGEGARAARGGAAHVRHLPPPPGAAAGRGPGGLGRSESSLLLPQPRDGLRPRAARARPPRARDRSDRPLAASERRAAAAAEPAAAADRATGAGRPRGTGRMSAARGEAGVPIGVLGGGAWGSTVAHLVATGGRRALLWARNPATCHEINEQHTNRRYLGEARLSEAVEATEHIEELASRCEVIFCAVPLKGLREVAYRLGEVVTGDRIVISCSKGLEHGTHKRPTEILKEESCLKKVGVLSGPNLAREILAGQPCATVIASRFHEVTERGTAAIMGPQFRVYASSDVVGVELAGALKNIVALAAGASAGMGFGANSLAALVTRGLAEMSRYVVRNGGDPRTLAGLAGVGDLIATCSSELSRNHQVGRRLAQGERLEEICASMVHVAEGVNTTRSVVEHARQIGCELPIAEAVYAVLFEGATPADVLRALMSRPPSRETVGV
ncbi:MAG: NAD(P)-dependent glycerol-3-phosphate dehydrogenase [Planctomycetota bacterium]|nr:MAG: NAD(P)-dependent glycerol-3-phosphate dehydrogenase [Planctomycetota bacterium]